jgi:hypothetical protein
MAGVLPSSAPAGSIGASGLATAIDAIRPASSRLNAGSPSARWKRRTYRSSTTSSIRSVTSSTKTASRSTSPATPRPLSTSWQNPCVVAIVAASKSATARARSSRRVSSGSLARSSTSRWRTRSRSSPVAMRVNVTSRIFSSGMPSVT